MLTIASLAALNLALFCLLYGLFPASSSQVAASLLEDPRQSPVAAGVSSLGASLGVWFFLGIVPMVLALRALRAKYVPSRDGLLLPALLGLVIFAFVQGLFGRAFPALRLAPIVFVLCGALLAGVRGTRQAAWELAELVGRRLPVWLAIMAGVQAVGVIAGRHLFRDLPFFDDVFRVQFVVHWLAFKPFENFLEYGVPELRYYSLLELWTAFMARCTGIDFKATYFLGLPLALLFLLSNTILGLGAGLTKRRSSVGFAFATPLLFVLGCAAGRLTLVHLLVRQTLAGVVLCLVSMGAFAYFAKTRAKTDFLACVLALTFAVVAKPQFGLPIAALCFGLSLIQRTTWRERIVLSGLLLAVPVTVYRLLVHVGPMTVRLRPFYSLAEYRLFEGDPLFSFVASLLHGVSPTVRGLFAELCRGHVLLLPMAWVFVELARRPIVQLRCVRVESVVLMAIVGVSAGWYLLSFDGDTGRAELYWAILANYIGLALLLLGWMQQHAQGHVSRHALWLAALVWTVALGVVGLERAREGNYFWCPNDPELHRALRRLRDATPADSVIVHEMGGRNADVYFVTTLSERRQAFGWYSLDTPHGGSKARRDELDRWIALVTAGQDAAPPLSPLPPNVVLLLRAHHEVMPARFHLVLREGAYEAWAYESALEASGR